MTFGDVCEFLSEHSEHRVLRSSITLGDILHNMLQSKQEVIDAKAEIKALTARAEQAEKWAAAAITDIERLRLKKFTLCPICEFEDMIECAHKNHCTGYKQFKWRGLPQDGEGKK